MKIISDKPDGFKPQRITPHSSTPEPFDAEADVWASVGVAYVAIRARMAAGGPGWGGAIQQQSREAEMKTTITTFELPGGVTAHWHKTEFLGEDTRSLSYEAAGREVGCDPPPNKNWNDLQDGELVSSLTWFWNVDDGHMPFGAYASQDEALQAARKAVGYFETVMAPMTGKFL